MDTNGPTAVEVLARRLHIPFTFAGDLHAHSIEGLNFSVSGAQTGASPGRRFHRENGLATRRELREPKVFLARIKAAISTAEVKQSEGVGSALSTAGRAEEIEGCGEACEGLAARGLALLQKALSFENSAPEVELGYGYFNGRVQAHALVQACQRKRALVI